MPSYDFCIPVSSVAKLVEPKLFGGFGAEMICFVNIDGTKVGLESAKKNKNSFLPPPRHISYVITVKVHFKVAI